MEGKSWCKIVWILLLLLLTEGYNYYLNMSLCGGEEISWIASYDMTPRSEPQVQLTGQENTGRG